MSIFEIGVHGMQWFGPPVGQLTIAHAEDADYSKAIDDLTRAREQMRKIRAGEGYDACAVCEDAHHAGLCHHNPLLLAVLGGEALLGAVWKCYHCGAVYTDEQSAANHFGRTPDDPASCLSQQRQQVVELLRRLGENGPDMHGVSRRSLTAYQRKWLRDLAREVEQIDPCAAVE
jgi:hypothetical protein